MQKDDFLLAEQTPEGLSINKQSSRTGELRLSHKVRRETFSHSNRYLKNIVQDTQDLNKSRVHVKKLFY